MVVHICALESVILFHWPAVSAIIHVYMKINLVFFLTFLVRMYVVTFESSVPTPLVLCSMWNPCVNPCCDQPCNPPALAEVSCRDAIRQARVTRVNSKGLKALGAVNLKKSESGAHEVFRKYGQSIPVKISRVDLPSQKGYPYVKFGDWLRYLVEQDELQNLVGVNTLEKMQTRLTNFWTKYKAVHPNHEIYHRDMPYHMTIPVLFHGDEGRGHKKKQVLVLSTHGFLGKGTSKRNGGDDNLDLNYVSNSLLTHFLLGVMPIGLYGDSPESFDKILEVQSEEFCSLFDEGIYIRGHRYFVACLGCKGDAPWLTKAGKLERAFTRRPTRASSKKAAGGICHRCLAGKEDWVKAVPYEDYGSVCPEWLDTMGVVVPYSEPSPLTAIPFQHGEGNQEDFYKFDIFHNLRLGIGKNYVSSALCIVLELLPGTIHQAFETFSHDFLSYCSANRESPYHKKLSASLFGVEQSFQDCPEGGWSKGDFTRLLLQWFGDFCSRKVIGHTQEPLYLQCVTCQPS